MQLDKNDLPYDRYGISVSKKVGNSVIRHSITRLIRESYRTNSSLFDRGYDIVVIARNQAKGKSLEEICNALIHLGKIHNIVK